PNDFFRAWRSVVKWYRAKANCSQCETHRDGVGPWEIGNHGGFPHLFRKPRQVLRRGWLRLYPSVPISLRKEHRRHPPGPNGPLGCPHRKTLFLIHAVHPPVVISTAISCASVPISGLRPIRAYT